MSLNIINLPPFVLQQLYGKSLIDMETMQKTVVINKEPRIASLGNNRKNIVILVQCSGVLHLPDDQLNLLMGILTACHLSMEDVAIVNIKNNAAVNYKILTSEFKAHKLLLFGMKPAQMNLPIDFPNYQMQQYNNQLYLTAPDLSVFLNEKAEKLKLWNCLKQLFEL